MAQIWFILEPQCLAEDLTSGRRSKYLWREAMLYQSAFLSPTVLERHHWSTEEADKLSDQFRAGHPPSQSQALRPTLARRTKQCHSVNKREMFSNGGWASLVIHVCTYRHILEQTII